jgi:hypothetical protein
MGPSRSAVDGASEQDKQVGNVCAFDLPLCYRKRGEEGIVPMKSPVRVGSESKLEVYYEVFDRKSFEAWV